MYQHILLATELINVSHVIEEKAALMQSLTGAKLSIIYVIEPVPSVYAVSEAAVAYDYKRNSKLLEKKVLKLINELDQRLNISDTRVVISNGLVSDEILHYANSENIDLIIIGSHGCHGIKLLLGSTANAVLHEANCDVLAVRIKEENVKGDKYSFANNIPSKEVYRERLQIQLDEWKNDINNLKLKVAELEGDTKAIYQQKIKQLHSMHIASNYKLAELIKASEGTWEFVKERIDKAMHEFEKQLDLVKRKFKSED